jgi:hypothetical protein
MTVRAWRDVVPGMRISTRGQVWTIESRQNDTITMRRQHDGHTSTGTPKPDGPIDVLDPDLPVLGSNLRYDTAGHLIALMLGGRPVAELHGGQWSIPAYVVRDPSLLESHMFSMHSSGEHASAPHLIAHTHERDSDEA